VNAGVDEDIDDEVEELNADVPNGDKFELNADCERADEDERPNEVC